MNLRTHFVILALALALTPVATGPLPAGEGEQGDDDKAGLDQLRAENRQLRRDIDVLRRQFFEFIENGNGRAADPPDAEDGSGRGVLGERHARDSARLGGRGGLFTKPFLGDVESRTYIGGYIGSEFREFQDSDRTFNQHRYIPFIFSQVTDQIRVAAEIEFEYGGSDAAAGDGETKIEFATVDYEICEAFGIRAGAILAPLGRFNLNHDSPTNDLTDRPIVDRTVIPTTLTESGMGIFGTVYPTDESKLDYEVYLVNGFRGLEADATAPSGTGFKSNFSPTQGLREGKGSLKSDNNNSVAGVGRVAFSPFLGAELGVSGHAGKYDDKGNNMLFIWAVDAIYQPWPALVFEGEVARAEISRNTLARESGVPSDMWGAYGQVSYHFMPPCLPKLLPRVFREDSIFTTAWRIDHAELGSERIQRLTAGLNFRPIEGTVFKLDYQMNFEDGSHRRARNDGIIFSVASYF